MAKRKTGRKSLSKTKYGKEYINARRRALSRRQSQANKHGSWINDTIFDIWFTGRELLSREEVLRATTQLNKLYTDKWVEENKPEETKDRIRERLKEVVAEARSEIDTEYNFSELMELKADTMDRLLDEYTDSDWIALEEELGNLEDAVLRFILDSNEKSAGDYSNLYEYTYARLTMKFTGTRAKFLQTYTDDKVIYETN